MKNLRKAGYAAMALMLVLAAGGCGTGSNLPGTMTGNTGNRAIGTGTAIVPGTSAIIGTNNPLMGTNNAVTGTNNSMINNGTNPGMNLGYGANRTNLGTNLGTTNRLYTGTNLGTNAGTNAGINAGTNAGTNAAINTTGMKNYKDGSYTASVDSANGSDRATVTISHGKIDKVVLRSFDKAGKEVNYSKNIGKGTAGTVNRNLNSIRDDIQKQVISRQDANVVINNNSAKTITDSWIADVRRALDKARQ